jgi:N-acetylmuramoyl-L-alanine amidase
LTSRRKWTRIVLVAAGLLFLFLITCIALCWAAYHKWFPFDGWKYIVIHHSASDSGNADGFHRYHLERGIPGGLAYHFVIGNGRGAKDGGITEGHRWTESLAGGHVTLNAWNYNIFGIGICLVGNLEKNRPTNLQWRALIATASQLCEQHGISPENIIGHTTVPWFFKNKKTERTKCPGRFLDIHSLRRNVYQRLKK